MSNTTIEAPVTSDKKIHSPEAIYLGAFLGTPLAAGYMLRHNYLQLGEPKKGRIAMITSVLATLGIFGIIMFIPEDIVDRVPNFIVPIFYSLVIYSITLKLQRDPLNKLVAEGATILSKWKAVIIGIVAAVVFIIPVLGYVLIEEYFLLAVPEEYEAGLLDFQEQEQIFLSYYEVAVEGGDEALITFIQDTGMPAVQASQTAAATMLQHSDGDSYLEKEALSIQRYTLLYESYFNLIQKDYSQPDTDYSPQIDSVFQLIEKNIEETL